MAAVWATYRLYWDWDRDGDFSEASEDISAYRRQSSGSAGCSGSPVSSQDGPGELRIELDNSTGLFSRNNSSSPYYGYIKPGGLVKLTMQIGAGTETTLWQGDLWDIAAQPAERKADAIAILTAKGVLGRLEEVDIALAMTTATLEGAIVAAILNAASFPAGDRTIDAGQSTIGRHWAKQRDALQAIRDLENTTCAQARESKAGKFVWEDRAHRASAPHTTVQTTYTNDVAGSIRPVHVLPLDTRADIFNKFQAQKRTFDLSEDLILWKLSGSAVEIPAGQTVQVEAKLSDTGYVAINAWTTIDWEANSAADGTGTDVTNTTVSIVQNKYGDRQVFDVTNSAGASAYLITLQAHGTAVVEGDPILVEDHDDTSITDYGPKPFPVDAPFLEDVQEARDWCDHNKTLFKDLRTAVTIRLDANANSNHLAEALRVSLSDRIHVHQDASSTLYIDADFWVERITHEIDEQGRHFVELQCAEVVTHTWAASSAAYSPETIEGIPHDLVLTSVDPDLNCTFGCVARENNYSIRSGNFRAKWFAGPQAGPVDLRTVAEGGTLVHDGVNEWAVDGIYADYLGVGYKLLSPNPGVIYFAFQFQSSGGPSKWSDGNPTPRYVSDYLATDTGQPDGPPSDWWVEVEPDAENHRVRVKASRPKTNGEKIWGWYVQIKDVSSYGWDALSVDSVYGPAVAYGYLGDVHTPPAGPADWIDHALTDDGAKITRESGTGFHSEHYDENANVGNLILLDRRGGANAWNETYCLWGTIDSIQGLRSGYNPDTATYMNVQGRFHGDATTGLHLLAINPPWAWNGNGYLGDEKNHGWWSKNFWENGQHGDTETEVFVSDWIDVPAGIALANIQGRAFFDNGYSTNDNGLTVGGIKGDTGNPSGASGLDIITNDDDASVPKGQIALEFNRETSNYLGILAIAAWLSPSLPGQGPYDVERDVSPSLIIETGTCTIVKGDKSVTVTRSASAGIVGKILCIYTNDASPDSDLDGNFVESQAEDSIVLALPFGKSGTFSYAVIEPWWPSGGTTTNLMYVQFPPAQCAGDITQAVWRTPCFSVPDGAFSVTLCSKNVFGLGTRLTASSASGVTPVLVDSDCVAITLDSGEADIDCSLGRSFHIVTGGGAVTVNAPTNMKEGRPFLVRFSGAGAITLDAVFNARGVTLARSSGLDYLGCIYNGTEVDCWWSKDA